MANAKFQELILLVCYRSETDSTFGATKLNKLLFYSDLEAFRRLGQSISGEEYQKLDKGPAPKRLLPELGELTNAKEACTRTIFVPPGYPQYKTFALREPNYSLFVPEEIAIVDEVVQREWGKTATDMSNQSHDFLGWQLAEMGEMIPLGVVFISDRALTREEKEYAQQLV